jgi:hypothetical protein
MAIVVVNAADGSRTPVSAFSFAPNGVTGTSLAAGSGSSVPNTNPLFAGSTWFGFSSAVNPFPPPALGPHEFTAFQFTVEVPESLLPLALAAQFAGGEGQSSGAPIFDGPHPAQYFSAAAPSALLTAPVTAAALSPAASALAVAALAVIASRRLGRRSDRGRSMSA